jgi:integrase
MRAGEIFALTWTDVDLKARLLTLRDTKNGRTRFARMTDEVVEMLFALPKGKPDELVFPARAQKEKEEAEQTRTKISRTFERAVDELKLNEGVTDPRQMVVFHTLRHTYASWMLRSGADLYTVSKLLGHRTIAMTERYGHVADETLQDAVRAFQKDIAGKAEEKGRNAE